jgi:hypothetical protein
MDVTELILHQHSEQRRIFALIDDLDPEDTTTLEAVWSRLASCWKCMPGPRRSSSTPDCSRSAPEPHGGGGTTRSG